MLDATMSRMVPRKVPNSTADYNVITSDKSGYTCVCKDLRQVNQSRSVGKKGLILLVHK
jgi:hypothetical protein